MRRTISLAVSTLSLITSTLLAPVEALAAKATSTAKSVVTYRGTVYSANWGDIGVNIQVKGKKIMSLTANVTNDPYQRSLQIDQFALPYLKQEALKSNTYKINGISGATETSLAFIYSLRSAMIKGHLA